MMLIADGYKVPKWVEIPVFSRSGDQFAAHYDRDFSEETQHMADAPRLTPEQLAAFDAIDEVMRRPELPLEMDLHAGDVQLINNMHIMHARTAYEDDAPSGRGRLLLRLWLAFSGSPELPPGYGPMLGATAAGTYRGGLVRNNDAQVHFGVPLEPSSSPEPSHAGRLGAWPASPADVTSVRPGHDGRDMEVRATSGRQEERGG
jgi:TfdA family taurine catabolism dioxygenase TauD